jgi:hypothetical protein
MVCVGNKEYNSWLIFKNNLVLMFDQNIWMANGSVCLPVFKNNLYSVFLHVWTNPIDQVKSTKSKKRNFFRPRHWVGYKIQNENP